MTQFCPLFLSAGMPRSGSTLLYNLLREILRVRFGDRLASGWIDDLPDLPEGDAYLIKTHRLFPFLYRRAQQIAYSFRDVRTAAVSRWRKFGHDITLEQVRNEIREYTVARQHSGLMIRYEEMIRCPTTIVEQLSRLLDIPVDAQEIYGRVAELAPPDEPGYSRLTLLHKDHFTHTGDQEWREIIPPRLQAQIRTKYEWWFRECGYEVA